MKSQELWSLIDYQYFERVFDVTLDFRLRDYIDSLDLYYRGFSKIERDEHILRYLQWFSADIEPAGPNRKPAWDLGWNENLVGFKDSGFDLSELTPHYYRRSSAIMRINGDFALPRDPTFEAKFLSAMHKILAEFYLTHFDTICELGSGPLHNIVGFANELKGKKFVATDWVSPPIEISKILEQNKLAFGFQSHRFDGHLLDFYNPVGYLPADSMVITFGSMEQLGQNFGDLLDFFMQQPARDFLHIEPIVELYDRSTLFDDLAYRYSIKRNYLQGFYPSLLALQAKGLIRILETKKIIGGGFHDGWTLISWQKYE